MFAAEFKPRLLKYPLLGLCVFAGLYLSSLYSYLLFHSLTEFFSIAVACGIFILAWNTRRIEYNPYLLFLGIAYLFIAGMDMTHTLSYKGMGVFHLPEANLATQLWIAARYLEAVSLVVAPLMVTKRFNPWLVMACYAAAVSLLLASIFGWRIFPQCFVPGKGLTAFKVISEYIISLILIAAAILTLRIRQIFSPEVFRLLIAAIMVTIGAELAFTFYVSVYGFSNLVGHFLKIISFFLIYRAVVVTGLQRPYHLLFRDLKQSEQALARARDGLKERVRERTRELEKTVRNLNQEILARERDQQALLASEEKYRLVVENAHDAIFIVQDEEIKFANPNAGKLTGHGRDALEARPFADLVHPADRETVLSRHRARLAGECPSGVHAFRMIDAAGKTLSVQMSATVFPWQGRLATLNFVHDVTRLNNLERQVRTSQKMEALGNLAAGISHDFKNILGVIIGYNDLAISALDAGENPTTHLEQIRKAADSALDLVKKILGFSRPDEQKKTLMKPDLALKEVMDLLRPSMPLNIQLEQVVDHACPAIWGDAGQIQQVVINLCTNAVQAMNGPGGHLKVSLQNFEVSEEFAELHVGLEAGPHVRLTVSDTGPGMDRETMNHLFEPFFTTRKDDGGNGLGLAVVHGIVTSHDGAITVYSEPGQGSTFNVYLPVIRAGQSLYPKNLETVSRPAEKKHIFLIDDQPELLEMNRKTLERLGYGVTACASSPEALKIFEADSRRFDLVLTDYAMPELDGEQLTRRMRTLRPEIPIIICTGYGDRFSADRAAEIGVQCFLEKPLLAKQLAEVIRRALGTSG